MASPFPAKQAGTRHPKHLGAGSLTAAGTQDVLAVAPVLAGESIAHQQVNASLQATAQDAFEEFRFYNVVSLYLPYTFGVGGVTLSETNIEEMIAEAYGDPLDNWGGDPGGAAGESDHDDWMGGDENIFPGEVLWERNGFLKPLDVDLDTAGTGKEYHYADNWRISLSANKYFMQDGFIATVFQWLANPQQDDNLGIITMDASMENPVAIIQAVSGGDVGDEDVSNQIMELLYGGDAKGTASDIGGTMFCQLSIDYTVRTPYPLPGNAWS